ncbi:ArsR/SmtB family transcription factor [Staphylococcus succinus]|jgi:DNA-binding transcriptional ArsR family regulator|uniref:Transcriptional regulator n=1 Tax=Staphylococcus succinus TaxID=61015 RepID=A0A9Q6MVL4_9STAP|nr:MULTISPECIES: metalloregulator ArsR/SmtB family transcription factor [Staphylococcus]MBU0439297.1 metalloregulator ArsR/SmtB family transcription factor [Staphylococcus succinus]MDH9161595.1 metalloregulator ArsR/SmtB family transcription factor [Staphylococcus succinus]MEB7463421.1 metalloregulator ArsR/SmtB family transcription factor [Staphylococcus succinus]MEB8125558.1 metalloregulator ArsR/SmtB family transcription factor [Staphylococcus succinus]MEB8128117.1 metalloregulator ArsR/Smt
MDDSFDQQTIDSVTEIFKALSDGNRIRIMHLLSHGECSVGHIAHTLDISQSNVSHQLRLLKQAHLVKSKRDGQSMIYTLDDTHVTTLLKQAIHHATHK